jgi:hypothetical protein
LAFSYGTITEADIDDLGIPREFDVVKNDQRAIDFNNRPVIAFWPPAVISWSCRCVDLDQVRVLWH